MRSAPRPAARSSLIARRLPPTWRESVTRAGSPSTRSSAPISNRRGSSLASSTTKAPSVPCGRPTLPMRTSSVSGSVGNLEHVALVRARTTRTNDAPQCAGEPPLLADHLPDVVGGDVEMEHDGVLTHLGLDAHGIRLVYEPARKPLEEICHRSQPSKPAALMRRETGAVGCAPFDIQSLIFASSRSI